MWRLPASEPASACLSDAPVVGPRNHDIPMSNVIGYKRDSPACDHITIRPYFCIFTESLYHSFVL